MSPEIAAAINAAYDGFVRRTMRELSGAKPTAPDPEESEAILTPTPPPPESFAEPYLRGLFFSVDGMPDGFRQGVLKAAAGIIIEQLSEANRRALVPIPDLRALIDELPLAEKHKLTRQLATEWCRAQAEE